MSSIAYSQYTYIHGLSVQVHERFQTTISFSQEEIQTMLDRVEKFLMSIGSDGFPERLWDPGIT